MESLDIPVKEDYKIIKNREYNKRYYQRNKDKIKENKRKYRLKNNNYFKKYYKNYKEYYKQYYQKNKQRIIERVKKYQLEHPEVLKKSNDKSYAIRRTQTKVTEKHDIIKLENEIIKQDDFVFHEFISN